METQTKTRSKLQEHLDSDYCVILHNDDINSFEHVINCLIKICNKTSKQAQSIAFTVHNNGKCEVMVGDKTEMTKISNQLNIRRLTSSVEEK